ncbi:MULTISPECIES: 2,' 3'-cyclic nucleotide 2'-phosphodiesterase [Paenibacillus]|uniref:2,' 3'-cyclic nucleotide 2'-phosphodiesterase n=2 Tax=Paenibacillus TaxID=44249 RepID=A0ABY3B9Z7_9BACL|nr:MULTISPECIES: 2,' 3'-cyclic nucleotide 2'-phosphodiesterase [Paenibacillus]MEE4566818.1 2,' 3'-cyclic nucleotide 2'-phosphodiesterase [Paenibacillus polymyxa]MEE4578831.1 2,' 3'-cyclic nucleotide 2'-phosphodiesterase [Paenibacillus polymyxa]RTZ38157.1 2,' 3'-cyclic nucleotide 2'-phosphodiesterase [Paenibacillus polymyxa]TQS00042.1 2,' 3'-cyclic nucleotide 2'-phosphodiesterase [Paenibacillus ottowii]TQS00111.1 2,' 3'-cyclic nucleotide 2'-phosphodiesterase [Paenibacillus ottowii]
MMKKWSYLLIGLLIGVVFATTGNAFADQIKSMVGQTVAGEYSVKVNGNSLSENAIVVDGKAHVPLRAVTDSLGASLKVDGKTIQIESSENSSSKQTDNMAQSVSNKYQGWPISKLEDRKSELEKFVTDSEKDKESMLKSLEKYSKFKTEYSGNEKLMEKLDSETKDTEERIKAAENNIAKYKSDLAEVNAALTK